MRVNRHKNDHEARIIESCIRVQETSTNVPVFQAQAIEAMRWLLQDTPLLKMASVQPFEEENNYGIIYFPEFKDSQYMLSTQCVRMQQEWVEQYLMQVEHELLRDIGEGLLLEIIKKIMEADPISTETIRYDRGNTFDHYENKWNMTFSDAASKFVCAEGFGGIGYLLVGQQIASELYCLRDFNRVPREDHGFCRSITHVGNFRHWPVLMSTMVPVNKVIMVFGRPNQDFTGPAPMVVALGPFFRRKSEAYIDTKTGQQHPETLRVALRHAIATTHLKTVHFNWRPTASIKAL